MKIIIKAREFLFFTGSASLIILHYVKYLSTKWQGKKQPLPFHFVNIYTAFFVLALLVNSFTPEARANGSKVNQFCFGYAPNQNCLAAHFEQVRAAPLRPTAVRSFLFVFSIPFRLALRCATCKPTFHYKEAMRQQGRGNSFLLKKKKHRKGIFCTNQHTKGSITSSG
jgi:hypothetical protein